MAAFDIQQSLPNNAGIESEITTDVINDTTPEGYTDANASQGVGKDPYSQQLIQNFNDQFAPAPIGPQGQAALYPGLKHDINVGSQSGSIIGGQNIYVPGGNIAAVDPILARRKAIDDAAKDRAKALKPFKYKDPTKLKDARFQEKFNEAYYNSMNSQVDAMKEKYGKDFSIVAQDQSTKEGRELIQTGANFEFIGREMDHITDLVAEIDTGLEDGSLSYTDETLKIYDDYKNLLGSFEDGDTMKSVDVEGMHKKLQGALSIEQQLGKTGFIKNIMGEVTGSNYTLDNGEYYSTKTNKKVSYKEALGQVLESLTTKGGPLAEGIRNGIYTKDDVLNSLNSKLKDQFTQTGSISKKHQENVAGGGVAEDGVTFDKDEPGRINIFDYDEDGNLLQTKTEFDSYYEHDVNTTKLGNKKTLKLDDIVVVNKAGERTLEGANNLQITGFSTVKYVDEFGNKRTKVVARANIESPVKRAYEVNRKGEEVLIPWKDYQTKTEEEKEKIVVREESQPINKMIDLSDHTYDQIRNQIPEKDRKNLDKARAGAFETKKKVSVYEYDHSDYSYDELIGAGWTDEEIMNLNSH